MAVTVHDSGGLGTGVTTSATFTPASGVQAGDLVLMGVDYNPATYADPPTPSGWTQLGSTISVSGSMAGKLFWKWAVGNEGGTAQGWTGSQWETSVRKAIWFIILRGVDGDRWDDMTDSERLSVIFHTTSAGSTSNPAINVSTIGGDFIAVSGWLERSSSSTDLANNLGAPSGFTLTSDLLQQTGGGACQAAVAWNLTPSSTSVGGGSWTHSTSGGWIVASIAVPVAQESSPVEIEPPAGVLHISGTAPEVEADVDGSISIAPSSGLLHIIGGQATKTPPERTDHVAQLTFPQLIAHRGGNPGPENTIHAARNAASIDPSILIEVDIEVLADGVLVGNHDDDIDRMASPNSPYTTGDVGSFTSEQWAQILFHVNTGFSGPDQPASFWHEFVTEFAGTPRILVPEIKDAAAAPELIRNVLDEGIGGQCIIQSFNLSVAQTVAAAGLHAMYLSNSPNIATVQASGIEFIGIDFATLTGVNGPTIVSDAHDAGLRVAVYLVNNTTNRNIAIAAGVDLIFTNSPTQLLLSTQVNAPAGTLHISGTAPTVETVTSLPIEVEPPAGVLRIEATAPTVETDVSIPIAIEPPAGLLTIEATAPKLAAAANIAATAGLLSILGTPPTVATGSSVPITVAPEAGVLHISGAAPAVTTEVVIPAEVEPPAGVLHLLATSPAITTTSSISVEVEPIAGLLHLLATAPAVTTSAEETKPPLVATAETIAPRWAAEAAQVRWSAE